MIERRDLRAVFALDDGAPERARIAASATEAGVAPTIVRPSDACAAVAAHASNHPACVVLVVTDALPVAIDVQRQRGAVPVLVGVDEPVRGESHCVSVRSLDDVLSLLHVPPDSALLAPFRHDKATFAAAIGSRCERIRCLLERCGGLYIAGAGTIGRQIMAEAARVGIPVQAFIDNDPARRGTFVADRAVRAPRDVDGRCAVVVTASGLHAFEQTRQLQSGGFEHVVSPSEFFFLTGCDGQPEVRYLDDLWENRFRYVTLFAALGDAESRRVLENVLQHRLSLALAPLAAVVDTVHAQWFDPKFLRSADAHVFVDGGAFDGDTVCGFASATGGRYHAIHAFEPDPVIAARGRDRVRDLPNVTVHAVGLGSGPRSVAFARTGLTDGRVVGAGDETIHLDALDRVVTGNVTYLKLDVEGAEAEAIAGARGHISADRPLIGVAVYHKAPDLWDMARRIAEIARGYRYYLRHYTQLAYETVLYASTDSAETGARSE